MASDEEDTNTQEELKMEGKYGVIFLIDARSSMYTKDIEEDDNQNLTRINLALKCCRQQLMNKIIAKMRDLVGVVLFGTEKSDPETKTSNVTLLQELNYPGAPAIKKLEELLQDADSEKIKAEYGCTDDFFLADALWYCSSLLSRSRHQLDDKRIVLFTDDSNPHRSSDEKAHMARKRALDLHKVKVNLDVVPVGNDAFNYTEFYQELVETVNGEPEGDFEATAKLDDLLERVNRYEYRKRRYAKLRFSLGQNLFLGASLYTLYREVNVLPTQSLSRTTNEPVTSVKQTYEQATGQMLLPSDVDEFLSVAGTEISFMREEKDALMQIMEPGLTLLGFKPASVVQEGQHCGSASFVYPEDTVIKGSSTFMKCLVDGCITSNRVALCCMTPRNKAVTKYFYLVPSAETYDQEGRQLSPCGFHAIPIPFDHDTREQVFDYSSDVPQHTLEIVKKIVKKLRASFTPAKFENPKHQQFWTHLEALALDKTAPELPGDSTHLEAQDSRLGDLIQEFNSTFELDGTPTPTTAKREMKSRDSAGPSKRVKKEDGDIDKKIKEAIETRKVDKFTVAQLKEFLTKHNVTTSSMRKKAEYVDAVYQLKF
ncbi:X-ray repair cross-complementing protein 6 isoform X2 [Macrosteles quadrilineatus]|uniref:X-ray repair cross-complementing protein 6 isoform X2 n=1 Tax=Macrosteles quadrilineatus TaxID=74068 RepID=UPI0023E0A005|nr:X-ray repair cross-complementing protein 6 isoform X2 [Macrosteles quadrilineatus]